MAAHTLPPEMLARYKDNPMSMDAEVRSRFQIPENQYYNVALYPEKVAGMVTIERERSVKLHKISKSDTA
jgi:hypothetical protein